MCPDAANESASPATFRLWDIVARILGPCRADCPPQGFRCRSKGLLPLLPLYELFKQRLRFFGRYFSCLGRRKAPFFKLDEFLKQRLRFFGRRFVRSSRCWGIASL